ncbi:hypothetical protein PoB_005784200 [Plakobranchus ocellatus]|uniref:Uncharacterized protein n=1 Tax=Plakobranchus ocellatus TaxID=259542 RepID=A0AAV4CIZ3_9GAST|nr:hypothetical protein PoB_005784200 [Plakobranchus ocellatus]
MSLCRIIIFFNRHEVKSTISFVLLGVVLLTTPLGSDCWVELRLRRVARCSTKDPVLYEHRCRKFRWTDHQVARAGLWVVCYSFPRGIVPQMYFRTDPYCADFDDDLHPAEWLDDARFFCVLAPILALLGAVTYIAGKYMDNEALLQICHVFFYFSGLSGATGTLKMYLHMDKSFLIQYRRARVEQLTHWPFFSAASGSLLFAFIGIAGHIDRKTYLRPPGIRKFV